MTEEELEQFIMDNEEYSSEIITWKVRTQRFLKRSTDVSIPNKCIVKLPKLEIKKFDGTITSWQAFWDQFSTAIHSNNAISKIDKFNYLKGLVVDRAAKIIEGLRMTEDNYEAAIDMLKKTFGRNSLIIDAHMNKLLNLKPAKDDKFDARSLTSLYEECEVHIRSLEALGIKVGSYGALLSPIIKRALPQDLLLEFNRKFEEKDDDVEELLKYVQKEIKGRERLAQTHGAKNIEKTTLKLKENKTDERIPSTAALHSGTERFLQKKSGACLFCSSKEHKALTCDKVVSVDARLTKLKQLGRCFLCLGLKHMAKDCGLKQIKCEL